jgi:hypothetical protein
MHGAIYPLPQYALKFQEADGFKFQNELLRKSYGPRIHGLQKIT